MKRLNTIIAVLLCTALVLAAVYLFRRESVPESTPVAEVPAPVPTVDTSAYVSLVLNPRATDIRLYWRDRYDRLLRTLANVRGLVESRGERVRMLMNGGMYHEDRDPVGLFVDHGRVIKPLDTTSGAGNFYLKPNGVFAIRHNGTAVVCEADAFVQDSSILYATQSGPMLLVDGVMHPVFEKDSRHLNIRNGVGIRPDGTLVFAISRWKVTLWDFATYFKEMGCTDALYLDGFVSRCYLPEKNLEQLDGDFGVMICVVE